jgi:hypothetical protein
MTTTLYRSSFRVLKFSYVLWAAYMLCAGALLLLVPDFVTGLFGFHAAADGWVRLFGALAFIIGAGYAFILGTPPNRLIIIWTISARAFFFLVTVLAACMGWFDVKIILVGSFDLINTIWTAVGFAMMLRGRKAS